MVKKLVVIFAFGLAILLIINHANKRFSPVKIEIELSSEQLPESEIAERLQKVVEYYTRHAVSDWEKSRLENALNDKTFLSHRDSLLVEKVLALKNENTPKQNRSFVSENKVKLYGLFFRALNENLRQRLLHPQRKGSREQNLEVAKWIAYRYKELSDDFLETQLEFYENLFAQDLKDKMLLELYYKEVRLRFYRHPKSAIPFLGAGYRLAQKLHDRKREIDLLARLQFVFYDSLGRINTAAALGYDLLTKTRQIGYKMGRGLVHFYLGHVLIDKGRFDQALQQYEQAKRIYESYDYQIWLTDIHERLGVVYRRLGRFDLALQNYEKMLDYEADRLSKVRYSIGIGLLNAEMGRYAEAERAYKESLEPARKLNDRKNEIIALINLGELFFDLGDYEQALQHQRQALKQAELADAPYLIHSIWSHLTELHIANHEPDAAKVSASNALKYLQNLDFGLLKATYYLNLGKLHLQIEDLDTARELLEKGLAIFTDIGVIAKQIETLNLIGETHRRAGNYGEAENALHKALDLASQVPELTHQWGTQFYLARVYRSQEQIGKAESFLNRSIAQVQAVSHRLINHEQRANFSQKIQPVFEEMVLLQLDKYDQESAFYFAERERAQVLKIQLQDGETGATTRELLTSRVGTTFLSSKENRELKIAKLQALLNDSTFVVEYEMTDSTLVTWVIGKDTFSAERMNISRVAIDGWLSEFRNCTNPDNLRSAHKRDSTFQRIEQLGRLLYGQLIAPISELISNARLIYFIPDETLNLLPFSALKPTDSHYLIERFAVCTMPSAAILQERLRNELLKSGASSRGQKVLAVGLNSGRLRYAEKEARLVATMQTESESLIGLEATEMKLREKFLELYQVLLLSTHGQIVEKKPYHSYLLLKKDSSAVQEPENDGFLMVHEIQRLKLRHLDLVYLSACETASGKLYRGEGMIGMQRAFMVAGARTVIANLWQIDDKTATSLTIDFFRHWLTGDYSKAEALRRAQINMINWLKRRAMYRRKPHPYFWAAATLTGANN